MKKLVSLVLALAMLMTMTVAVTASAEEYEPITIQFWNGWTGSDQQVLREYVDKFNETNKWHITIDMDSTSEFNDKIVTALAADAAPALILTNAASKYDFEGKVVCMDDIWDKTSMKKEDFVSSYLDSLSTEDGLYGIPFQISSYVLYWNKDLFAAAGLDPETPPKTYDEYTEFAAKLTDPDKHVYGSGLSYTNVGADACVMQMFGGLHVTMNDEGKWQANFANNQGYIDFVKWIKYQFEMGYNPVESDLDTMFIAGQLGMYITGAWLMADLNVYGTNYGVTTLIETPEGGKQAPSNTQCFMVTTCRPEAEQLAAYRFIEWWHVGNEGEAVEDTAVYAWSDRIGYPTYYVPVAESAGYQANERMAAITITDPEYMMDSVAPGSFRRWASMLQGPLIQFFNAMVFEEDTAAILDECQAEADRIIKNEYGY